MCKGQADIVETLKYNKKLPARVRSELFYHMVQFLLHKLGCARDPKEPRFGVGLYAGDNIQKMTFIEYKTITDEVGKFAEQEQPTSTGVLDLTEHATKIADQHGQRMARLFLKCLRSIHDEHCADPFSNMRVQSWTDTKELKDLFESEDLTPTYGKFFDKRYLNYLNKNFDMIDKINWRKFEGLTAEYFSKIGYLVSMGPGRNDNGIDLRLFAGQIKNVPPLIIVQCKRTKKKVDKVIVKSLYADILDEKAMSGLIVTTSSLIRGAADVCAARSYPIKSANRETLRGWIRKMASP